MPGPVSDSYDPEWGTGDNAARIGEELDDVYDKVHAILQERSPLPILELIDKKLPLPITGTLTEKDWRLIRFALERASDSI